MEELKSQIELPSSIRAPLISARSAMERRHFRRAEKETAVALNKGTGTVFESSLSTILELLQMQDRRALQKIEDLLSGRTLQEPSLEQKRKPEEKVKVADVLLVGNNPHDRGRLKGWLGRQLRIVQANAPYQAIMMLHSWQVKLVVTDWNLGGDKTAEEIVRFLRDARNPVPIIILADDPKSVPNEIKFKDPKIAVLEKWPKREVFDRTKREMLGG